VVGEKNRSSIGVRRQAYSAVAKFFFADRRSLDGLFSKCGGVVLDLWNPFYRFFYLLDNPMIYSMMDRT
jgi:hypothetical protein